MLLPIRTNIWPRRTPYMNYALIAVNVFIFLVTYWPHRDLYTGTEEVLRPWAQHYMLTPAHPFLWQFISYSFLHGGLMHIIGNMFFLYLFGNNVNDKIGHIGYLCFYLAGAVFSGVGHTVFNSSSTIPTLGASGAIAAVTGAYLMLFPQTLITVLYWFYIIGTTEVPALYFIAFKMILIDNLIVRYTPNVAYDAHLAGYTFGMAAILGLLATGLIDGSNFDLWAMMRRWNRRRRYQDVVSSGYDPFTGEVRTKQIKVREIRTTPSETNQGKITELRNEISSRIAQRNLASAAQAYLELIQIDGSQILPRQQLLDVANQLASENRHAEAACAYEQFLTHYSNYEYAEQVELMLGIFYSRYLNKPEPAIKHLQAASEKLADPSQLKMCRDELDRLKK
jgi:membrane associated rhomboid family serine protease